ncbi:hypothetical protein BJ165DRAFT_1534712 [Panaeolus papilionaceus]|nr:hypothetical protein BJ165DRAFT_1534712 [Panaeolus papilionaceus]
MSKPNGARNSTSTVLPDGNPRQFKYLKIIGPVSVKRIDEENVPYRSYCMVLVGPTGSGKSSFIEALNRTGSNPPLDIAKDQLDGVTQQVTAYHLEGVTSYGVPIYLIDTPGFADPNISEMKILNATKIWRAKSDGTTKRFEAAYVRIIYMSSITDIRLGGRRRNYLSMTQNFWGDGNKYRARLVTTMWDCLVRGSESYTRAVERFSGLDEHWQDLWDGGSGSSYVLRFLNTHQSAMDILNKVCRTVLARSANEPSDPVEGLGVLIDGSDKTTLPVYKTLEERIDGLQQRLQYIKAELDDPATVQYPELVDLLTMEREECIANLEKFVREMAEYLEVEPEKVVERLLGTLHPPPYIDTLHTVVVNNAENGSLMVGPPPQETMPLDDKRGHGSSNQVQEDLPTGPVSHGSIHIDSDCPNVYQRIVTQELTSQKPDPNPAVKSIPLSPKPPRFQSLYRGLITWLRVKFRFKDRPQYVILTRDLIIV